MIRHAPTRLDLIKSLASVQSHPLTGAEVGVMNGDFSAEILTLPEIFGLYLIDPWQQQTGPYEKDPANVDQGGQDARYRAVCARFQNDQRVKILRSTSLDAARDFPRYSPDAPHLSLSFAYLDAAHDYNSVLADLRAWSRVAPVLLVHDFIQNAESDNMGFAVVRAVHDFIWAHGWYVTALTSHDAWPTCQLEKA